MFAAVTRSGLLPLLVSLSVAGAAVSPAARGADLAPSDRLLPPNTLLFIRVPNCAKFLEDFQQSALGRMVNDPAMAEVRAEVMRKFEEASREAEQHLGLPLSDLFALPTGEFALALVQPPGQKLGIVAMLDFGDHEDVVEKLLEKVEGQLTEDGELTRSTKGFEGTEITVWTNENAGPRDPFNALCYCVKDARFVVGTSTSLLEAILVRWDGQHDQTFARDEVYKYILERCRFEGKDEPGLCWFLNPLGLFKAAMAAAGPEIGMQGAMVMGFLPVLGFDRLKGIGGTADLALDEYEWMSKSLIYVDQPVTGMLRALVCPPAEQTPPKFISAETSNISGLHWDVPGAYDAVGQVWDFFTAPGTFSKMMDDAARDPNGPGLHPKTDILDLLTGQVYMIQDFPRGGDLEQQRIAFLFGVNNTERMQDVIAKVTSLDGVSVDVREFRGHKIYEPRDAAAGPFSPALAVANGYLIFAMNVEMLEGMLRGDAEAPLATSPDYLRVAKEFPGPVSTFFFQRLDAMVEAFYEGFRNGLLQGASDEFDPAILPDFEALRKYFGIVGSYSVPDERGVFMVSFGLKSE